MPTRTVTGTIYGPDGLPWQNGKVAFLLMEPFVSGVILYPIQEVSVLTDSNGQFSRDIAVPATGTAHYDIVTPDGTHYQGVYIAAGVAVDLSTLITLATSVVSQNAIQTLLDQYATLTVTSTNIAYAVQINDDVILCNGTFTVSLPAAAGSNRVICIKNIGIGTITIDADGMDLIDGLASQLVASLSWSTVIDAYAGSWYRI